MKWLVIVMFVFSKMVVVAQTVALSLVNPAPRAGDEVMVNYSVNLGEIEIADGSIKIKEVDTGKVMLGPYAFTVDGKMYSSDTMSIHIDPKLPNERNGFWVRQVKFKDEAYLITEQRIAGEWKTTKSDDTSFSMSFGSDGVEYAKIIESSIVSDKLEIDFSYSSTGSQTLEGGNLENGTVHYAIHIYRIKKKDGYAGDFQLRKKHFENFPDKTKFDPLTINK